MPMKIQFLLSLAVLTVISTSGYADGPETTLGNLMKQMSSSMTFVSKNLETAGQKQNNLDQLKRVKTAVTDSRIEIPALTNNEPDKIAEYKGLIDKLLAQVDALEAAVTQDEIGQARTILKAIDASRKTGHTKFKPPQKS